jgi:hypothetical protein
MFQAMEQKVKDAQCDETKQEDIHAGLSVQQNFILDNLPLAKDHLKFIFSSIDSQIKCSEILASVNGKKVMPRVNTSMIIALRDILPMVNLEVGEVTSNVAGCNWVSYHDT